LDNNHNHRPAVCSAVQMHSAKTNPCLDSSPPRHRRDFLVNNRNSKVEHPFSNQKSNTNNLFGSNAFGNQTTGTDIKFSPVTGTYTTQQQPGFGAALFDTPRSNTTNSSFGQTNNKTGFGQPQDFGQTPSFGSSTIAFGVPNQTNTSSLFGKPTTFVTTTSNASSTFGFNPPSTSNPFSKNEAQKSFSQPLFRTTTTQLQSAFSTYRSIRTNKHSGTSKFHTFDLSFFYTIFAEYYYQPVPKTCADYNWIQHRTTGFLF
jgi:hypothetical protein